MNGLIPFGIPLRMKKFSARLGRLGARNLFRPGCGRTEVRAPVGFRRTRWVRAAAFTLVELLVVIAIIGLLATIGLPALKGFGKGTGMAGAQRQLLQDLGLARLSAINGRTTVYMVFVPTNIVKLNWPSFPRKTQMQLTNLVSGQYTTYALLTKRTLGDQPGRENPRYITDWRSLPQGILIATNKFDQNALTLDPYLVGYPADYK